MHDALLDRLQRAAAVGCMVMALVAFAIARGDWRAPASVVAGGVLIGISFVSIRGGIEALATHVADRGRPPKVGLAVVKMAGRYALLALLAYVMIARLRLYPLGLLAGASSIVAAAALEASRLLKK